MDLAWITALAMPLAGGRGGVFQRSTWELQTRKFWGLRFGVQPWLQEIASVMADSVDARELNAEEGKPPA